MRVIPVLDLKGGVAVRAVAGDRAHYAPVAGVLHEGLDPLGLARAYRDALGLDALYLADLDAIAGDPPALPLYGALAGLGLELWVDPGVRDGAAVGPVFAAGASGLILGLETLGGPEALADALAVSGPDRLAFSLDLRGGRALPAPGADWPTGDPRKLAELAIAAGLRRVLILDLARVGTGGGIGPLGLASDLAAGHPGVEVWVGGGVAGPAELARLHEAGVAAVLVGSALLDGRIGRAELATWGQSGEGRAPR